MPGTKTISLRDTARARYLNYALSVITSRALPDIRDGLKPVQRRILYTMFASLRLYPDARYRKSATIVGDAMGKYHPHGDTAIYDAMARMAQDFSLRDPLVDGHGNFGSIDGDRPAAMRYTEARLRPLAMEMLQELRQQTVAFRPNFDGTLSEPVVLPARFPNLLVNGATGIAVGMATNIPPHNLGEVVDAAIYMVDAWRRQVGAGKTENPRPAVRVQTLLSKFIKGPDFPTGGCILNTAEELVEIYKRGEGPILLRGEYKKQGARHIIITAIPYAVTKGDLVEKIAEHIAKEHVPQLTDIRDESTDDVRIVLELKRGANANAAMAYLFKHTQLRTRFHVNLTCLVPTENPHVPAPEKVDLVTALHQFLEFRLDVVTRRLQFELEQLEKRIHILEGFERIFDALDEAIKIIRSSRNKADSSQRLRHRFQLTEVQAEAILETKLYKLSQLEIEAIHVELEAKRQRAEEIRVLLGNERARWTMVREELAALKKGFATPRRSIIAGPDNTAYEFSEEDFIVDEDAYLIVTRDGWVKRQRSYTDAESIRIRDGDEVGWILPGRTRNTVAFLTSVGQAYTIRVDEVPSTRGHGVPLQKLFKFADNERLVGVISVDRRILPKIVSHVEPELFLVNGTKHRPAPYGYLVAFTKHGMTSRLLLDPYVEPSTKVGRRYMRPRDGDEILVAYVAGGEENACLASRSGNVLIFPIQQIPVRKAATTGVIAMGLDKDDYLMGAILTSNARVGLVIETSRGRRETVRTTKYAVRRRASKGHQIIKQGHIARVLYSPVELRLKEN